jgi:hypothetical protein
MAGENTGLDTDLEVEIDDTTIDEGNAEENIDEGTEEGEDEETSEGEGDEEETVTASDRKDGLPAFKAITEKYPKFFKEFPGLRTTYFREREFSKIFPNVEEAQEAQADSETLQTFTSSITSGDVNDLTGTMKAFKDMGDNVIPDLAMNFLPALQKISPDDYYSAITPLLLNFVQSLYSNGKDNDNENLMNAGLLAAQHFFKDMKVASGETKINTGRVKSETKDTKLDEERRTFQNERYTTFYNDVTSDCDSQLMSLITTGLDPNNRMSATMREMTAEKVKKEVDRVLSSDSSYMSGINSLWKKAGTDRFSSSHKPKIINTYLGRAKEIMPGIRAKIRASVLGLRVKSNEGSGPKNLNRKEPQNNTGTGGERRQQGTNLKSVLENAKNIDWSKTTDRDVMNGRATYKK